ncbi:hypothetical protein GGF50DRAFT_128465 [Schizophyllum commune]
MISASLASSRQQEGSDPTDHRARVGLLVCTQTPTLIAEGPPSMQPYQPHPSAQSKARSQGYEHWSPSPPRPPRQFLPSAPHQTSYAAFPQALWDAEGGQSAEHPAQHSWAGLSAQERGFLAQRAEGATIGGDRTPRSLKQREHVTERELYRRPTDAGAYYSYQPSPSPPPPTRWDHSGTDLLHVPYRGDEMRRSPSPRSMMAGAGLPSDHGLVQSLNGEREKLTWPAELENAAGSSPFYHASASVRGRRRGSSSATAVSDYSSTSSVPTVYDDEAEGEDTDKAGVPYVDLEATEAWYQDIMRELGSRYS